jgi:VanZ family protein
MSALGRSWLKRRGIALDVAPAGGALLLMFWFGLIPLGALPGPQFELADKLWHLVAFAGLAGLLSRAFIYFGRTALLAAREASLIAVTLGAMLELLQSFTRYRSSDWADLLADALGVALAYAVLRGLDLAAARGTA